MIPPPVRAVRVLCRTVCRQVRSSLPPQHLSSSIQLLTFHHLPITHQPHRSASSPPRQSQLASPASPTNITAPVIPASDNQRQTDSSSSSTPPPPVRPSVWVSFLTILSLFPVLLAVDDAIVTVATVNGRSMQPTLNPHLAPATSSNHSSSAPSSPPPQQSSPSSSSSLDKVLVWKLSSQSPTALPVGSLVVLKSPYQPSRHVIKRLVGREGDWITVQPPPTQRRRDTHTAATAAAEDDAEQRLMGGYGHIEQLGKGRVWVEGENEEASVEDSREYGQMPAALVQGRAVAVVWPPSRMRWIENSLQHVGGEQRIRNRMMAW